jgi:hypothetical protein
MGQYAGEPRQAGEAGEAGKARLQGTKSSPSPRRRASQGSKARTRVRNPPRRRLPNGERTPFPRRRIPDGHTWAVE